MKQKTVHQKFVIEFYNQKTGETKIIREQLSKYMAKNTKSRMEISLGSDFIGSIKPQIST